MIKIYAYKKCSSCRKAESFLIQLKLPYIFIDITTAPPTLKELRELIRSSRLGLKSFLNSSGEAYRALDLKNKLGEMSEDDTLALLANNGRLLKRPIITDGNRVTVGFKDEVMKMWSSVKPCL